MIRACRRIRASRSTDSGVESEGLGSAEDCDREDGDVIGIADEFDVYFPMVKGVHGDAWFAGGEVLGGFEEEFGGCGESLFRGDGGLGGEWEDFFVVLAHVEVGISAEVQKRVFETEEAGAKFGDVEGALFCIDLGLDGEGFVEADGGGCDGEAKVAVTANRD